MSNELSYHRLRTALKQFGEPLEQLDNQRREWVERQAQREFKLEQRVLGTSEAAAVHISTDTLNQAMAQLIARYPNENDWHDALHLHGLDEVSMRIALERELRVEAVFEQVGARAVKVTELDIQIFYHLHRERFRTPELRTTRHILMTINPDFPENTVERVMARIDEIAMRVRSKPHRFADQAVKHSECPTAMQGGLLGKVKAGQLYPELDAVLFSMDEGDISGPVQSEMGFHLLSCEVIQPAGMLPLHEAAPRIRQRLEDRYCLQCQRAWLAKLARTSS